MVDSRDDRRSVMRYVIEADESGARVVGEAGTMATALELVDLERADVVVIDVQMPVEEGLATIAALRRSSSRLGIVVCSFALEPATAERALAQGADSCLAKPVRRKDLHGALASFGSRAGDVGDAPPPDEVPGLPVLLGAPATR